MKRIRSACITKTIHFQLKDGLAHAAAVSAVKDEAEAYLCSLDRKRTVYKVLGRHEEPDGSIILELKMQYNNHPVGSYLDEG
jgi:hypothetical protein